MKTYFHSEVMSRSGKMKSERIEYAAYKEESICVAKKSRVRTVITEQNVMTGNKLRSAVALYKELDAGFKASLKVYAAAFNKKHLLDNKLPISGYNVWIKGLCRHSEVFSSLSEVFDCLGGSLGEWIERGYLEAVKI